MAVCVLALAVSVFSMKQVILSLFLPSTSLKEEIAVVVSQQG